VASDIIGLEEVKKLLKEVGKAPGRVITVATKKGANIALKQAKQKCPESIDGSHGKPPGTLRKSLKLKKEKRKTGKSVYTIGADETGWYSHFVDYGFTDKAGVKWEGNHFLRNSVDDNRSVIDKTILTELANEIDKLK
jgi:HK97 gp10 family phage protein